MTTNIPRFATQEKALAYIRHVMPTCPEEITVIVDSGVDEDFVQTAFPSVDEYCGAHCYRITYLSNQMTLHVEYKDDALILAVFRGTIDIDRLTPLQRKVYEKAISVATRTKFAHKNDEYGLALALHDWVGLNSRYNREIHKDGCLAGIILHGEGRCECYSRAYRLLCRLAGLDCRYIVGVVGEPHAWNIIKINGQWVHVDCTHDDPTPDTPGRVQHLYFGMSDATISRTRTWDRDKYPACSTESLWYMKKYARTFPTLNDMALELVRMIKKGDRNAELLGYVEEVARVGDATNEMRKAAVNACNQGLFTHCIGREIDPGFVVLSPYDGD